MDLTPWAPAIAAGGVVLGIVVTFTTGWLTRRQTSAISLSEQKASLRDDRREAIFHYLEAIQRAWQLGIDTDTPLRGAITKHTSDAEAQQYFRARCLYVLCTPALREAAERYTRAMLDVMWDTVEDGTTSYDHIKTAQDSFMDLARKELYAPRVSD